MKPQVVGWLLWLLWVVVSWPVAEEMPLWAAEICTSTSCLLVCRARGGQAWLLALPQVSLR